MNSILRQAAEKVAKQKLLLVLENEMACNTATAVEAVKVLATIQTPSFLLSWDPRNAAAAEETAPYPDGYALLLKNPIGHCHVKSAVRDAAGKYKWTPVGQGIVDWMGQFRALNNDGYRYAVSLVTHWRGGDTGRIHADQLCRYERLLAENRNPGVEILSAPLIMAHWKLISLPL
jgi:L-ribulose-5-phosphate 3-epimerase